MLPVAVHMGLKPSYDMMHRISNDSARDANHDKPYGGLWSSVLDVEYGTDWLRWCDNAGGGAWAWHGPAKRVREGDHKAWMIHANPNARVLEIQDEEDYEIVKGLYPREARGTWRDMHGNTGQNMNVDWEGVSKDYDIVWVHKDAQRYMRDWDCETILFMTAGSWQASEIHEFAERKRKELCDA